MPSGYFSGGSNHSLPGQLDDRSTEDEAVVGGLLLELGRDGGEVAVDLVDVDVGEVALAVADVAAGPGVGEVRASR